MCLSIPTFLRSYAHDPVQYSPCESSHSRLYLVWIARAKIQEHDRAHESQHLSKECRAIQQHQVTCLHNTYTCIEQMVTHIQNKW